LISRKEKREYLCITNAIWMDASRTNDV